MANFPDVSPPCLAGLGRAPLRTRLSLFLQPYKNKLGRTHSGTSCTAVWPDLTGHFRAPLSSAKRNSGCTAERAGKIGESAKFLSRKGRQGCQVACHYAYSTIMHGAKHLASSCASYLFFCSTFIVFLRKPKMPFLATLPAATVARGAWLH